MNFKNQNNGLMTCISLSLLSFVPLTSCQQENDIEASCQSSIGSDVSVSTTNKQELMNEFANVLSTAVYSNQDLRAFLKEEALIQFDKNYDIF